MSDVIGRGENRAVEILKNLYPTYEILQQVPIQNLISKKEFDLLGKEHHQHKHDIVMISPKREKIVIEVNYKHGQVSEDKWNNVYKPLLEDADIKTCTIEDAECTHLFELALGEHLDEWEDWVDVIRALDQASVWEEETD